MRSHFCCVYIAIYSYIHLFLFFERFRYIHTMCAMKFTLLHVRSSELQTSGGGAGARLPVGEPRTQNTFLFGEYKIRIEYGRMCCAL